MTFDEAVRAVVAARGTPPDYRHVAPADLQATYDAYNGVEVWLRPVSWRERALRIGWYQGGVEGVPEYPLFFYNVPGTDYHVLKAFEVLEDWEVVNPDTVLGIGNYPFDTRDSQLS